jgi:hypothetical protein
LSKPVFGYDLKWHSNDWLSYVDANKIKIWFEELRTKV